MEKKEIIEKLEKGDFNPYDTDLYDQILEKYTDDKEVVYTLINSAQLFPEYDRHNDDYIDNLNDISAFVSDRLRDDKEFNLQMVKDRIIPLSHIDQQWRDDKEIVLEAIVGATEFDYVSDRLKDDKDVVLKRVKMYGTSLGQASDRLRDDPEVVLEAVKSQSESFKYASDRLQELCKDKDPVVAIQTEIKRIEAENLKHELEQAKPTVQDVPKPKRMKI